MKKVTGTLERNAQSVLFTTKVNVGKGKVLRVEAERFLTGELTGLVAVEATPLWKGATVRQLSSKRVKDACSNLELLLAA